MTAQVATVRSRAKKSRFSQAEWEARVALAAAYRISAHLGWEYLIYNHIALRAPDAPYFFIKPHNAMFSEVRASDLMKLRLDGKPVSFSDNMNPAAFVIHTAILNARPDINCTLHVHTEAGMAMSAHKKGLLPITQNAMRFHNRVSYHDFEGYATNLDESKALGRDLGPRNKVMILRNHGLLACGGTASEAVFFMWNLIMCCETQLKLEASGAEMIIPPPGICERTARQAEAMRKYGTEEEYRAFLRILDRLDPSYKT